jgi:hypothetical protein
MNRDTDQPRDILHELGRYYASLGEGKKGNGYTASRVTFG